MSDSTSIRWNVLDGSDPESPLIVPREDLRALRAEVKRLRAEVVHLRAENHYLVTGEDPS